MSGLAGVFSFEAPVTRAELEQICAHAAYRGPDGTAVWTAGPVGLGYLSRRTLPDHDHVAQPLVVGDGALAIVFDGRIDNREDLGRRLGATPADAALALQAYRQWGRDAAREIIGDFAMVVWDRLRRTLYCARDAMGVRPLYYHASARGFVCASDIGQILTAPGVPLAPNEGMIGEYLANFIVDRQETVYAGVYRLPAAHWLEARESAPPLLGRYWRIDAERALDYRSDDEYAEHFRSVFLTAVKDRLRSAGPVGVYFSGGTDSAAVLSAAAAVAEPTHRPAGFTVTFDDPASDELAYVEDLSRFCSVESHVHRAGGGGWVPRARGDNVHDFLRDGGVAAWKQRIAAGGCHVMLSGMGGDAGFFGSCCHYADLLRARRCLALWRQARGDARTQGIDWSASLLLQYGVWPLLPVAVRRVLRPLARRWIGYRAVPPWIESSYARRVGLESRIRPEERDRRGPSAARDDIRREMESGWNAVYLEAAERESEELGLEDRHPFLDRRVVEFALAIPDDQRWRGNVTRYVVRNGLAGLMSPLSRSRTTRGDGAAGQADAIRQMGAGGLFSRMALADAGLIREDVVGELHGRMLRRLASGDSAYVEDLFPLWMIGGVELWFRITFGSGYNSADPARRVDGGPV